MRTLLSLLLLCCLLFACSVSKKIHQSAQKMVLQDSALLTAHVGISIYEPATGKWWYNWQGDKYFVPASNIKIATCYAAMKYLGDSLVGARYFVDRDGALELFPTADPTFLHSDFKVQPVFETLKRYRVLKWNLTDWKCERWGNGWSWNDYDAGYMAERSPFPIYGNVMNVSLKNNQLRMQPIPPSFSYDTVIGYSPVSGLVQQNKFRLERDIDENHLYLRSSTQQFYDVQIPMRMGVHYISKLLKDTLQVENVSTFTTAPGHVYNQSKITLYSQATDSLLKPMMHRSDNFFAEQALLMVSNELLGYMNEEKIIDTLLKTDFADLPQRPRWADGSGLSRYNLFTPQDFVIILRKMKDEFGMDRLRTIFASGGKGTLSNFYKTERPYLYAKTGTLAGVVALSGYLTTAKGKELIISVQVNNHRSSAVQIRRTIEEFLQNLRDTF